MKCPTTRGRCCRSPSFAGVRNAAILGALCIASNLLAEGVDLKGFFTPPPVAMAVSPSGQQLAFVTFEDNEVRLFSRSSVSGRGKVSVVDGAIDQLMFVNESLVVYRLTKDSGPALVLADVTRRKSWLFTPPNGARVSLIDPQPSPLASGRLFFALSYPPDKLEGLYAIAIPAEGVPQDFKLKQISDDPEGFSQWLLDADGTLVGGVAMRGGRSTLFIRDSSDSASGGHPTWTQLLNGPSDTFPEFTAFAVSPGYLMAMGYFETEFSTAVPFEIRTKTFGQPLLPRTTANIRATFLSPDLRRADAYSTWDDPDRMIGLSDEFKEHARSISKLLHSNEWTMLAAAPHYRGVIVAQMSNRRPSRFWHVDLKRHQTFLFHDSGKPLDRKSLSTMRVIRIRARDGLDLPCFKLTNDAAAKAGPAILWVNGGPFEGLHNEWQPHLQYLATTPAVVIAMNYRGATGFGRTFYESGRGAAATSMVDDVEDVLRYIAQQPDLADRPRIVVGASFGGYLALQVASRGGIPFDRLILANSAIDPETVFQGGLQNGATIKEIEAERRKWFGVDESAGRSMFEEATSFASPMLIIQSRDDEKVSPQLASEIAQTRKERGLPVTFRLVEGNHEIASPEHWMQVLAAMHEFIVQGALQETE